MSRRAKARPAAPSASRAEPAAVPPADGVPDARSRDRGVDLPTVVVIAALTLFAFWPAVDNGFVQYDDQTYVTANPQVTDGLTLEGLRWAFTTGHAGNWHPLTWLSHMLDVELFGLDAGMHHLTSLLLHALSAGLLYLALRRLTLAWAPSAFAAALFALHPLRVESVVWAAERKDVLSGLFWMLALLAWARYARAPGVGRYLLVAAALVAGLLAKSMVVTLPVVLLVLDVWPLGRWRPFGLGPAPEPPEPGAPRPAAAAGLAAGADPSAGRWPRAAHPLLEKLPLLALAAAAGAATFRVQAARGAVSDIGQLSLVDRLATSVLAWGAYLWKTVWPTDLACLYPHPAFQATRTFDAFGPWVLVSAAVLALLTAGALRAARRRPWLLAGWLWYLIVLLPVIGIVHVGVHLYADRYTYLPSIGLGVAVAWSARELVARRPALLWPTVVAGAAVLGTCVVLSRAQTEVWRDDEALFTRALEVTEDNYIAHNGLGKVLDRRGRRAEAIEHLERAVEIRPDVIRFLNDLGAVLLTDGEVDRATELFERAIELHEPFALAHANLGLAKVRAGRPDEAERHYRDALRHDPDLASARLNLGAHLMRAGDPDGAIEQLEAAVRLRPDDPKARMNLAQLRMARGDERAAIGHYRRILRVQPPLPEAAAGLAWILATSPDPTVRNGVEAVMLGELAASTQGTTYPAYVLNALAAALAEVGRFQDAANIQGRALQAASEADRPDFRERYELYRAGQPYRRSGPPR